LPELNVIRSERDSRDTNKLFLIIDVRVQIVIRSTVRSLLAQITCLLKKLRFRSIPLTIWVENKIWKMPVKRTVCVEGQRICRRKHKLYNHPGIQFYKNETILFQISVNKIVNYIVNHAIVNRKMYFSTSKILLGLTLPSRWTDIFRRTSLTYFGHICKHLPSIGRTIRISKGNEQTSFFISSVPWINYYRSLLISTITQVDEADEFKSFFSEMKFGLRFLRYRIFA